MPSYVTNILRVSGNSERLWILFECSGAGICLNGDVPDDESTLPFIYTSFSSILCVLGLWGKVNGQPIISRDSHIHVRRMIQPFL